MNTVVWGCRIGRYKIEAVANADGGYNVMENGDRIAWVKDRGDAVDFAKMIAEQEAKAEAERIMNTYGEDADE